MSNLQLNTIELKVDGRIGHLIMVNEPSNTMSMEFFREMGVVKDVILKNQELKAILIYSRGRHFSSGVDLDELLREISGHPEAEKFLQSNYASLSFLEMLTIPVISVITGVCLGSALEMAFFSHFRFCSEAAVLGLPETTFNLIPGIGGIRRFASLAGTINALDFILTGRTFDALTALNLGLVDLLRPRKKVIEEAGKFAHWLPGNYVQEMKQVYLKRYGEEISSRDAIPEP